MDENRFEGTARNVGGKVQEGVGRLTGDAKTQASGKMNQVAGQVQDTYGAAADSAREILDQVTDRVRDQPLTAVLVALGVGYVVGRIGRLI